MKKVTYRLYCGEERFEEAKQIMEEFLIEEKCISQGTEIAIITQYAGDKKNHGLIWMKKNDGPEKKRSKRD